MKSFFNKKSETKVIKTNGGFLLVELIVALFVFAFVMTISMGSIINLLDANKKNQSQKSVMNNLNLVLDSMTKTLAVGRNYECGGGGGGDCPSGADSLRFLSNEDIDINGQLDIITYALRSDSNGGYITREIDGGGGNSSPLIRMTAPEINVTALKFIVKGTGSFASGNRDQPKVTIWVDGTTKDAPRGTQSAFHVQTIVSQRIPDNL